MTRVGVAGVGRLGSVHAALYRDVAGAAFAGLYDADQARAAKLAGDKEKREHKKH